MTWWNPWTWWLDATEDNAVIGINDTVEDIRADISRCSRRYLRTGDVYWLEKKRKLRKRLKEVKCRLRKQP